MRGYGCPGNLSRTLLGELWAAEAREGCEPRGPLVCFPLGWSFGWTTACSDCFLTEAAGLEQQNSLPGRRAGPGPPDLPASCSQEGRKPHACFLAH